MKCPVYLCFYPCPLWLRGSTDGHFLLLLLLLLLHTSNFGCGSALLKHLLYPRALVVVLFLLLLLLFLHTSNFWMQKQHLCVSLKYRKHHVVGHVGPLLSMWSCFPLKKAFSSLPTICDIYPCNHIALITILT